MQETSTTYKSLLADSTHEKETRMYIADVEYGGNRIFSVSVSGGLFANDTISVGGCVAREVDLVVMPQGDIPRMAEIRLETRLIIKDLLTGEVTQSSEWIPKGTFFIDTRYVDTTSGAMVIHGYDAMLKMEQLYLADGEDVAGWPKPMPTVMEEIAAAIGVELDMRNELQNYLVEAPAGYTMREVAGWIAAAHAGNWTITDAGKLRLVPLYNPAINRGYLVNEEGAIITFGGVRILVTPGGSGGGNDSGTVVNVLVDEEFNAITFGGDRIIV